MPPSEFWNIADDSSVTRGADTASVVVNSGLFEKSGGSGTSQIGANISNSGKLCVESGILDFQHAVSGSGTDTIAGAATLEFDSTVAAGQTIDFTGSDGAVFIAKLNNFAGTISGYDSDGAGGTNDIIKLLGSWTEVGFSENVTNTLATLILSKGVLQETLKFAGNYTSGSFNLSHSGGYTVID